MSGNRFIHRLVRAAFLPAALVLLSGCLEIPRPEALVWSPNGERAAFVASGLSLYVTDTHGTLSPRLHDSVYRAAWMSDSRRLVLARRRDVTTFASVAAAIGPERTREVIAEAQIVWSLLALPLSEDMLWQQLEPFNGDDEAIMLYLRDRYGHEAIVERVGEEVEDAPAVLHAVITARLEGDRLQTERVLYEDLRPIGEIRVAPHDRAVAFIAEHQGFLGDTTRTDLVVAPLNERAQEPFVVPGTGDHFDWTPDGRSLAFFEAEREPHVGFGALGVLVQRRMFEGDALAPDETRELVRTFFGDDSLVRTLGDGRVLFNVTDLTFPRSPAQVEPPRLFASGLAAGAATFTTFGPASPDPFVWFAVSPDRGRVLYGTRSGRVHLLTPDCHGEVLPLGFEREGGYELVGDVPRATWAGPDAIGYLKRIGERDEFVLRRGATETVLTADWPDALMPWPVKKR